MEYEADFSDRIEPRGPDGASPYDMDEVHRLQTLIEHGLCSRDNSARQAHRSVLDAEARRIESDDDERDSVSAEIRVLKKNAARFCMQCAVNDICYDYGVEMVKLDYGVLGALPGTTRKSVAKEQSIPQHDTPRIRGRPRAVVGDA